MTDNGLSQKEPEPGLDWVSIVRSVILGVSIGAIIALLLFAATGIWPPSMHVTSGSMEPNISEGSIIVVTETGRFSPQSQPNVVTVESATAQDTRRFGKHGDVIVFQTHNGTFSGYNVVHRAHFWVDTGENWYSKAHPSYLPFGVNSCDKLKKCPAPSSGYITKGDNNDYYDQSVGATDPVHPSWILGEAVLSIPLVGYIRLLVPLLIALLGTGAILVASSYIFVSIGREVWMWWKS